MSTNELPTSTNPSDTQPRRLGLFVAAIVLFGLGLVFTVLAVAIPLISGSNGPTWVYVAAMIFTPLGFLLGIIYALLGSRPPR